MREPAGPARIELVHDVSPAPERCERVAAAYDLAEGGQVGPYAEQTLRATRSDPEGDHLVEDQQRAGPIGQVPERGEEPALGGANTTGALDGLDDDRREIGLPPREHSFGAIGIAPGQRHHEGRHFVGHPGRARHGRVVGAVIGALEVGHERPAGEGPGGTDREHRRLRAGVREPQHLDRRKTGADLLRKLDLRLGRRPECRAAPDLVGDRRHDGRMGVTEDQARVVPEEVAVRVAVNVADDDALAALDVRRVRRGVDRRPGRAARQRGGGPVEQGRRARCSGDVSVQHRAIVRANAASCDLASTFLRLPRAAARCSLLARPVDPRLHRWSIVTYRGRSTDRGAAPPRRPHRARCLPPRGAPNSAMHVPPIDPRRSSRRPDLRGRVPVPGPSTAGTPRRHRLGHTDLQQLHRGAHLPRRRGLG